MVTSVIYNRELNSGGCRRRARGAWPHLVFRPNWGPKGEKKIFLETAPPLPPPLPPPSLSEGMYNRELNSGRSRGRARGAWPHLVFRPNWGPKCEKKIFLETAPPSPPLPSPLPSPLPTYLKVWIRHCFSNDDDDCSENVAEKMNLRSFIGNFSWSWILKNIIQVSKEKGKLVVVCSCPP